MKSYKISLSVLSILAMSMATSCIDDSSTYGVGDIPVLSVTAPAADGLPQVNFNYGEEVVITPQVKYTGSQPLTYTWSVGTYDNGIKGALEEVGNEEVLRYSFPAGGVYYAHLTITDGAVGAVQEYQVNVRRSFEEGWMIVSNNASGVGNLSFIKTLTPEEIAAGMEPLVMEHCLERVNDNIKEEKLIGAAFIQLSWPVSRKRLVVATESKALFLDPNNFNSISTIEYSSVVPGFKGDKLLGSAANPRIVSFSSGKSVQLKGNDMFGVADEGWQNLECDAVFSGSYEAWGNINYNNVYVKYEPLTVYNNSGYYMYFGLPDWLDSKNMMWEGKPIFENEELVSAFQGIGVPGMWGNSYYMYLMTRNKTTGKLYNTYISDFGDSAYGFDPVFKEEIPTDANTAVPAMRSSIVATDTYKRLYYHNGQNVYVMLENGNSYNLPSASQYALSYPANEEITYLAINEDTELMVATCDKTSGRGNLYIYDIANVRTDNPNANPKAKYMNCADRISFMCYKPRVSTTN